MAVKSQRIARTGVLGLLLVVSLALMVAPASALASVVMEAPTAGAVTGATPTFSGIASRTKAWVSARYEHDMEDSMAASSVQ
jgi:hypothetical protein